MKHLILDDGRKINHPDDATPEAIGKMVAHARANPPKPKPKPEDHPALKRATEKIASAQKKMADEAAARKANDAARDEKDNDRHASILDAHAATTKATQQLGAHTSKISSGLNSLGKNLQEGHAVMADLARQFEKFDDVGPSMKLLAREVGELRETLATSVEMLIALMKKPRKVLRSGKSGPLLGVAIDDDEKGGA